MKETTAQPHPLGWEGYLDNAATTPPLPKALEQALPLLGEAFGNPSSLHARGMGARRAIKGAREQLARLLGVPPREVIFTSGGTESDNLALRGVFESSRVKGERLLYSAIEHPAVQKTALALQRQGVRAEPIPVDEEGVLRLEALEAMLDSDVRMLSCIALNNELGTTQPLPEIGALLRKKAPQAVFHVDAVQAFTKIPLPWRDAGVHLLSLSGHKVHGPPGAGALVRLAPLPLEPWLTGGGQEGGLRSGTENSFAIVAFAQAASQVQAIHQEQRKSRAEYFQRWHTLLKEFPRIQVFQSRRATPFVLNFSLPPIPGEVTLYHLEQEGLQVSTGSACHTRTPEPSPVLLATGMSQARALCAIRLSFSIHNTLAGLPEVFTAFRRAMRKLEQL